MDGFLVNCGTELEIYILLLIGDQLAILMLLIVENE